MEVRGIYTTHDILAEKAAHIWKTYPIARNYEPETNLEPSFGRKWQSLFEKRWNIQNPMFYRKAGSAAAIAPLPAIQKNDQIKALVNQHFPGNRYNFDQTGLFWRRLCSSGLAGAGGNFNKNRISVGLPTNDTGDDHLETWLVGKYKEPHSLRDFNWKGYRSVWRHNNSAWFTTPIMVEWLTAFYAHITRTKPGQKVLLLMDSFQPHEKALLMCPPPSNITVDFFPLIVASLYQPLNQGMISTTKYIWRRKMLHWMCFDIKEAGDPVDMMDLRLAIVWLYEAFYHELQNATIIGCWRKATLLGQLSGKYTTNQHADDLKSLFTMVMKRRPVLGATLNDFLTPPDEDSQPGEATTVKTAFEQAISEFSNELSPREDHSNNNSDDEPLVHQNRPDVTTSECIICLMKLLELSENSEVFESADIAMLRSLKARPSRVGAAISNQMSPETTLGWIEHE